MKVYLYDSGDDTVGISAEWVSADLPLNITPANRDEVRASLSALVGGYWRVIFEDEMGEQ